MENPASTSVPSGDSVMPGVTRSDPGMGPGLTGTIVVQVQDCQGKSLFVVGFKGN